MPQVTKEVNKKLRVMRSSCVRVVLVVAFVLCVQFVEKKFACFDEFLRPVNLGYCLIDRK